jgi:alpha-1,2-mannosyltransferase
MTEACPNAASEVDLRPSHSGRWRAVAWVLWLVPMVVIAALVVARPNKRTLTPLYEMAVRSWWDRQPLYRGPSGMNYLPHFAVLYGPYDLGGRVVGGILWRCTAAAGLAAGLWFFGRAIGGSPRFRSFAIVSAISLPLALPALQNGQANAHLGAALLLAAWCLKAQRWNTAVALLWLATCIKPLGLAAVGLAWAAYPHLGWRLAFGFAAFLGFPFLFGPPGYVWSQYVGAWENLRQCSEVTENRFADLNGLLRTFGAPLTGTASLAVRASAGALLMLWCWRASGRETEPRRALVWLSAAAGFLMLFNPMTEANSYAILAPVLGLMAGWEFSRGETGFGWAFACMALTMGLLPNLVRPVFGNHFALAWHPAMTLGFLSVIVWQTFRSGSLGANLSRQTVVPP